MTISKGEWESIYSAINAAKSQSEITEGIVVGHHDDGEHVFVDGFGTEPVGIVSLEYNQTVYKDGEPNLLRPVPIRPEIGERVLVARSGGSLHNPRIIGVIGQGFETWKQPSDIELPQIPTGCMMIWPKDTPPVGWLICNGDAIPAEHTALIALIGANTPDMEGRVPAGWKPGDFSFGSFGSFGGDETVTLTENQMPSHNHDFDGTPLTDHAHEYEANSTQVNTGTAFFAQRQSASGGTAGTRTTFGVTGPALVPAGTIDDAGFDLPHNNLQPYRILNFIIKV